MGKIKERGKMYALHKASEKLHDYYGSAMLNVVQFDGHDIQCAFVDGYLQAEQNLEVKEVDFDYFGFYWGEYVSNLGGDINNYEVAKYFYELGFKAQKEE